MKLSPIVIFTYRRVPEQLIKSLLENSLSEQSEVFIFSDGAKNDEDLTDIKKVREYLKTIDGFKSIDIIEADTNKGLATSIIGGVTQVINKYGKAIVLEDDLVVSKSFLEYMNEGLVFFENDKKIWSISGYGPELPCLKNYNDDIYLSVRVSPWGWATWSDRWEKIDWEVKDYDEIKKSGVLQKKFNLAGNDMFKMLELQMLGKIDSWAVRWYYNQFKLKTYSVYPKKSKVVNIGFSDDKGTHTSGANEKWFVELNDEHVDFKSIHMKKEVIQCFQSYHNLNLTTKMGYFLKKHGGYKVGKSIYEYIRKYIGI